MTDGERGDAGILASLPSGASAASPLMSRRAALIGASMGALMPGVLFGAARAGRPRTGPTAGIVHRLEDVRRPTLIRGGRLLTLRGAADEFEVADLLVVGGKIAQIGPNIQAPSARIIDASNMVVAPGFIDGHRHLWEGVLRNELPTQDLAGYIQLVSNTIGPVYSPDDVYIGTLASALGALDAGITTIFDWSHIQLTPDHTAAAIAALRDSGTRAVFCYGKPAGAVNSASRWPQDLLRLRKDEFASDDQLLTLALATNSPETAPDEVARAHFALARQAGVLVTTHAGIEGVGRPGEIGRFGKAGLLGPDVNLVHCNSLSPEEWRIVADTGTSVSITPSSEMQMGHGIPPIQAAREVGVMPTLGVDVETTVPGDMWTQMRIIYAVQRQDAFTRMRASKKAAPPLMTPREVLQCGTVAGAKAAMLGSKTGSVEVGKQADLILLRTDLLDTMPINHLEGAVLLNMDPRNVDTVMVAGSIVKQGGRMLGIDMDRLHARLVEARDRVFARAGVLQDRPRGVQAHDRPK